LANSLCFGTAGGLNDERPDGKKKRAGKEIGKKGKGTAISPFLISNTYRHRRLLEQRGRLPERIGSP
jgi:hypothetical protein